MRIIDCHVHLRGKVGKADVERYLEQAGVDGAHLFSEDPQGRGEAARECIGVLARLASDLPGRIVPLAWLDPLHPGAARMAEWAVRECGMRGIKLIPRGWYPEDACAREVYAAAASLGIPVQFHSGILWSPGDTSRYCRPAFYETMWDYPTVRFSLAHIGWPWCDECIAVAQKMNVMRPKLDQAFVDLTPGTPPVYRRDAMAKCLAVVGAAHMMYGSDSCIPAQWWPTGSWKQDDALLAELGASSAERTAVLGENAERFMGLPVPSA
jgi:uncharacterized protein